VRIFHIRLRAFRSVAQEALERVETSSSTSVAGEDGWSGQSAGPVRHGPSDVIRKIGYSAPVAKGETGIMPQYVIERDMPGVGSLG